MNLRASPPSPIARGMIASVAGLAVLPLSELLERGLSGHPLVYTSHAIATRLAKAHLGLRLTPARARAGGVVMRCAYGLTLGAGFGHLRAHAPSSRAATRLALGIYLFELVALPRVRATPPLRTWPTRQLATLALHTLSFALVTNAALARLPAPRQTSS